MKPTSKEIIARNLANLAATRILYGDPLILPKIEENDPRVNFDALNANDMQKPIKK